MPCCRQWNSAYNVADSPVSLRRLPHMLNWTYYGDSWADIGEAFRILDIGEAFRFL